MISAGVSATGTISTLFTTPSRRPDANELFGIPRDLHNLARCHLLLDLQRRAVSLLPTADENDRSIIRQRLAEYEAAIAGR